MSDGHGCECRARGKHECSCDDVDWTPKELIDARVTIQSLTEQLASKQSELDWVYLELCKIRPAIRAIFDREVWDRAANSVIATHQEKSNGNSL